MSKLKSQSIHAIGLAVKAFRNRFNLTQQELSTKAEMDRTYLAGIERGERNVSIENLLRISKALKVKLWKILKEADQ